MKRKVTKWYNFPIANQLHEGESVEDIDVELKLFILKVPQAEWIKDLNDYLLLEQHSSMKPWKMAQTDLNSLL